MTITKDVLLAMDADKLCSLLGDDFYPENFEAPAVVVVAEAQETINDGDLLTVGFYLEDRELDDEGVYALDNIAYFKLNGDEIR